MDDIRRELVRSWMTKALSDLKSARLLGLADEPPLDTALYHGQPTAEKSVKAYLVACGVTLEKTHGVRKLTVQAYSFEARFNEFIDLAAVLTPYAWEFRYPDDLADTYPTLEEFEEAVQHAQVIHDFVLSLIPAEARP
jgi:HEPN domain-containing protein